jgi:hypothetical protein
VSFKKGDKVVLLVDYGLYVARKGTIHTVNYVMDERNLGMIMLVGWTFGVNPFNIRKAIEMELALEGL